MKGQNNLCCFAKSCSGTDFTWYRFTFLSLLIGFIGSLSIALNAQPLAEGKDKFLGCAMDDIHSNFANYWNQVTPGDAGKWGSVESSMDSYNWSKLDNIYNYALSHGFQYKHHTLIWGNQQPSWIATLDSAEQRRQIEEWIRLVGEKYPEMDFVDVVNEPFNGPPSYMSALGGTGTTGWDWVITAFELARQYCAPGVKLILNEYNVLHDNTITSNYLALIDTLMVRGLIDAIGIQGHYFEFKSYAGGTPSYTYSINTIEYNLDRLVATGLPVYITEFDINEVDDNIQLENYQTYFPLFWENPGVKGITLWGYVQYDVWKQNAYLITDRRAERPALKWLRTYIASPLRPEPISPNAVIDQPRNPILVWNSSESATSYNVHVSKDRMFASLAVDTMVIDTLLQLSLLDANSRYYWRVSAVNHYGMSFYSTVAYFTTGDQITTIDEPEITLDEFKLFQNYPNPFNPTTTIKYVIPLDVKRKTLNVKLIVYDVLGNKITTLVNEIKQPGTYEVKFDATGLSTGIYFYKLQYGEFTSTKKLTLIK